MRRPPVHTSNFLDTRHRGSAKQLADRYEKLALEALHDKDDILAIRYSQHAEHWKRLGAEERRG